MFSYVEVTGYVVNTDGTPAAGQQVKATLSAPLTNGNVTEAGPYYTKTAAGGVYRLRVPCTADVGTSPASAYLTFTSGTQLDVAVTVPTSTSPVTLASLPAAPAAAGEVLSVNGQTGAVMLGASDVGADPAGTAAAAVTGKVAPSIFLIPAAAEAPTNPAPVQDQAYFDTTLTEIGVYNDGAWIYTGGLT